MCIRDSLEGFTAETVTYRSVDSVVEVNEAVNYPVQFPHILYPPDIRQHFFTFKVGTPVIGLRSLNPPKHWNSSRLLVKTLYKYVIVAIISTGCGEGETVSFPASPTIHQTTPSNLSAFIFCENVLLLDHQQGSGAVSDKGWRGGPEAQLVLPRLTVYSLFPGEIC